MVVGAIRDTSITAVRCNEWLDDPRFEKKASLFHHIHRARKFYRQWADIPIYMYTEDIMVAVCQDFDRVVTSAEEG